MDWWDWVEKDKREKGLCKEDTLDKREWATATPCCKGQAEEKEDGSKRMSVAGFIEYECKKEYYHFN